MGENTEKDTMDAVIRNYKRAGSADRAKVNDLLVKAKGPKRSMRQFAMACGVSPSTFTRIGQAREGPVSSEMLYRIAAEADPDSGVTFDNLMVANGMCKDPGGILFEEDIRNILISEILNRGFSVKLENDADSEYKTYTEFYLPNIHIFTDAIPSFHCSEEDVLTKGKNIVGCWIFEICQTSEKLTSRASAIRIYQNVILPVWGRMYCQTLGADKISFVVDDRNVFDILMAIVDDFVLPDWTSIILIDKKNRCVEEEHNIFIEGSPDIPDVFLKNKIDSAREESETLENMDEVIIREDPDES